MKAKRKLNQKTEQALDSGLAEPLNEDDIRDYAYHLYVQNCHRNDLCADHWREARACLGARIPKWQSHLRLHRHLETMSRAAPGSAGPVPSASPTPPISEDDIRGYAYHLYVQSGCIPGRDLDNWLEAKACLSACIPMSESHARLHRQVGKTQGP